MCHLDTASLQPLPGFLQNEQEVLGATDDRGVDMVLEMLANVNLGKDLPMLAQHGRVVVVGSRGPVEINPRDLMSRNADIRGVFVFGTPPPVLTEAHLGIVGGLKEGKLCPIVAHTFPLGKAAEAHRKIMAPGAAGKIVLVN